MAISTIISYVCVKNITNSGEAPLRLEVCRLKITVFSSGEKLNKLMFCFLDILQIGWSIFGLAEYYEKVDNEWAECIEKYSTITRMIPVLSFIGLLSIFRMIFVIVFFLLAKCIHEMGERRRY